MGTVMWVGLIVIVAVVAFFIGAFVTKKQFKQDELKEQAEQAKSELEKYRQNEANHLARTSKLLNKMKDTNNQLWSHVKETNQFL